MKALNDNWLTEGVMDVELKKYTLLAYLQACEAYFKSHRLYPPLSDLIRHLSNVQALGHNLESLNNAFPKSLAGINWQTMQLEFDTYKPNEDYLAALEEIMEFANTNLHAAVEEGRSIFDEVERNVEIQPVGVMPIYNQEGYLLFQTHQHNEVWIYQYACGQVMESGQNLRGLAFTFLGKEIKSIANTIEQMKWNLIKRYEQLPTPATFLCFCKREIPFVETLLPVAKRMMLTRVLV